MIRKEAEKLYQKECPYCDLGENDCECFDIARAIAFMEGHADATKEWRERVKGLIETLKYISNWCEINAPLSHFKTKCDNALEQFEKEAGK
jgi:hypothetical protein